MRSVCTIQDWPVHERPRERLMKAGPEALSDAELLAIFIRTGTQGKTAVDVARELLARHGNLLNLMQLPYEEFAKHPGMGPSVYSQLQASLELCRRYLMTDVQREAILKTPGLSKAYFASKLKHYQDEAFACAFLDTHTRVIAFEVLFHGTVNWSCVHPRTLIKRGLYHNAAQLMIGHNHPSGVAQFSEGDMKMTMKVKAACGLVDIQLMDHVLVAGNQVISMQEAQLI